MSVYKEFFNFRVKPFELVPNPDFLYMSRTHRKAAVYLNYGLKEKIGFMLLTGEAGSGKTTLLRNLIKNVDGKVNVSKVFNTKVNSEQLITMINDDFGLDINGRDKVMLLKELYDFLIEQYAKGYHSVLIIDEAQNLNADLLEEVRLLSNLETDSTKLIQIILAGQPELRKTLDRPELRQLRQRISISCNILPLSREETQEYIVHRLEVAGNRDAVNFSVEVVDVIHGFSMGIPRFINIICDYLMLTAFVEEKKGFTADLVKEVIDEIEIENTFRQDKAVNSRCQKKNDFPDDIEERLNNIAQMVYKTNVMLDNYIKIWMRQRQKAVEDSVQ
jgi:putative secretion ATPase (PEP-CTERM system associated)